MSTQTSPQTLPPLDRERPARTTTALLALGCFWSPDALFGALPGVVRTSSGYAGGTKDAPTYRALGDHTETVEVEYDPEQTSYEALLEAVWEGHDPTRRSWKRQYRSALFTLDEEQVATARTSKAQADEQTDSTIRTAIEPVERFHLAEGYHQNHGLRQHADFERVFKDRYPDAEDFAHSSAASRVNGYLGGYGSREQLEREVERLGLPEELQGELRHLHERAARPSVWQRLFG
jgi:methionine-S-sulfoxide reductase